LASSRVINVQHDVRDPQAFELSMTTNPIPFEGEPILVNKPLGILFWNLPL